MTDIDRSITKEMFARIRANDAEGIRRLLCENPGLIDFRIAGSTWAHVAAEKHHLNAVKVLIEEGIPANGTTLDGTDSVLGVAAGEGDLEIVKWLIESGADVNVGLGKWAPPLVSAIYSGSLDVVRLLVDRGARTDFSWGDPPQTPLSFATDYGYTQIVNYLESLEASRPAIAGKASLADEIREHVQAHIGPVQELALTALVSGPVPVTVNVVPAMGGRKHLTLVTTGMSAMPMRVPDGRSDFRYAELMVRLPRGWRLSSDALAEPAYNWPIDWLHRIANHPFESRTWLTPYAIFANGEPPEPLAANTKQSCLLATTERSDFGTFEARDGRLIQFYSLYPLYTEERDLEQRKGIGHLLGLFQEHGVSQVVDLYRPNVALL